jgi:hypothetical protein
MIPFKLLGLILLFIAAFFIRDASATLAISEVKFYKTKLSSPGDEISGQQAREKLKRIYARFTIVGSAETIAYLQAHGYLKVTVEWRIDGKVLDSVEVGITQEKWEIAEDDLVKQVAEDGIFRYRTTTYRTYIPIGRYELTIRDADGNILSPPGFQGPGIYKPTIKIIPP